MIETPTASGGDLAVLESGHCGLPTNGDVLARAAVAADAFMQDTGSPTTPHGG
ncbi:hypothetical protein ACTG9Q_32420 [Actinokineospora sp. 24-640]